MNKKYISYKEKLLDPRWQKRRLEILSSDSFTCQWCGEKEKTLHVHHFCYSASRNPWESEDSDMTTLCCDCHQFNHLDNLPKVIEDLHSLLLINPTVHGESMKLLVKLCINEYKK